MTEKKQRKLLQTLADALNDIAGEYYGEPAVLGQEKGFPQPTLCWDGPFEWIACFGGTSIWAGDTGRYGMPQEPVLTRALDEIASQGGFIEPLNNCQVCVYDA